MSECVDLTSVGRSRWWWIVSGWVERIKDVGDDWPQLGSFVLSINVIRLVFSKKELHNWQITRNRYICALQMCVCVSLNR